MTYEQSVDYIHSFLKFGIKPGLERIEALCAALGLPGERLRFVHVAGTNGKGSTCAMTAEILMSAGYHTGLFTSPYVFDFRERIMLDGELISREALCRAVEKTAEAVSEISMKGLEPTEFEVITATALVAFEEAGCEVAVLETGLGGRLDSTNVIRSPEVCALTSISYDHTAILGDTLEKIAREKCGIIKSGVPVVCYPEQAEEAMRVIESTAAERGCELVVPRFDKGLILSEGLVGSRTVIAGGEVFVPFAGEHMVKNALTAAAVGEALSRRGFRVSNENIREGISRAKMPARIQIVSDRPLTLYDGGHNEGCAAALAEVIRKQLSGRKIAAVCGMMEDKDIEKYLARVAPLFDSLTAVRPDNPRAAEPKKLAALASKYCRTNTAESTSEAVENAKKSVGDDGAVVICGSFYLF